jgi:hypothetical protein
MSVTDTTDVSLTRYGPSGVTALHDDLQRLRSLDRSPQPAGGPWDPSSPSPDLQVLTARIAGRLAGYVTGQVADTVEVREVVVTDPARQIYPNLPGVLVEAFAEGAFLPWADVIMPREPTALAHMISCGWRPVADEGARIRLSATRSAGA